MNELTTFIEALGGCPWQEESDQGEPETIVVRRGRPIAHEMDDEAQEGQQ